MAKEISQEEELNRELNRWKELQKIARKIKKAIPIEIYQQFHKWRKKHNLPDESDVFILFLCCAGHPLPILQEIREIGAEPTEIARIVSEAHILELFIYRNYLKFEAQPDDNKIVTDVKGKFYEMKEIYPPWGTDQVEYFIKWTKERGLRRPSTDSKLHKAQPFSVLIYELVEYLNPFFLTGMDKLKYRGDETPVKEEVFSLIGQMLEQCFPEWFSNPNSSKLKLKSRYHNQCRQRS